mmetsp:Transcript_19637/g.32734  ORF Transcript_19637/g.32734 Transcript_19637/m.32734 type:complete len:348 (-) Transcript_19637:157-1200(-)|eukprot:CAMPEP_0119313692 /NCGR_PEP_ID=MMETSP1333-20130426/30020_1 /TAXON_ID=418940 /ORGANISM="Scyphosphaera apsteinii, Strain RCC1455" /LENGTH=347 /DNA_ID=CAMNT_0007318589 /DNA_START=185 /DNA_END=1228 /DNA_ORIENTATION=-
MPLVIKSSLTVLVVSALLGLMVSFMGRHPSEKSEGKNATFAPDFKLVDELLREFYLEYPPRTSDEFLRESEKKEAELRIEMAAEPGSARLQAKLAQSLLETNGSRIAVRPDRLAEGRALVKQAAASAPEAASTLFAQVALLLAEEDVQISEAAELAGKAASLRQKNPRASAILGKIQVVQGCAHVCDWRRASNRLRKDPPNAVYAAGKDPKATMQASLSAANKMFVEAGKRLQSALDSALFKKDPSLSKSQSQESQDIVHAVFAPIMLLLQLEKVQQGLHIEVMAEIGECKVFEGRKLNGRTCARGESIENIKQKSAKAAAKAEAKRAKELEKKKLKEPVWKAGRKS